MSDPADLTAREDAVRRLCELHDAADDADRPRAALYVGLASADLIELLPQDDRRCGELAADALSRLDGLDGDSPESAALAERLRGVPARRAGVRHPARRGRLELGRGLGGSAGSGRVGQECDSTCCHSWRRCCRRGRRSGRRSPASPTCSQAFERGQWTPERDRSLKAAIEQVETGGLGAGLAMMLRLIAMTIRVRRCQQVADAGGRPQWPSLAELDELIAGVESAEDLRESLAGPFQAMDGLHHMYIAVAVCMRLHVDTKRNGRTPGRGLAR